MKSGARILFDDLWLNTLTYVAIASLMFGHLGCVAVPVRVPTQTRGVSGAPLELDLTFLKSGLTTKEQVTKSLAAIDTGVNQEDFFWGRWDTSKWRTTAVGFVPPDGERVWRGHNLLVRFDRQGTVQSWVEARDDELVRQLDVFDPAASAPTLDFSSPQHAASEIPYSERTVQLTLSSKSFEFQKFDTVFTIPRIDIIRITPTPGAFYDGPVSGMVPFAKPDLVVATVYFTKSPMSAENKHFKGKKLELALNPPTFLLIRRYISQTERHTALN